MDEKYSNEHQRKFLLATLICRCQPWTRSVWMFLWMNCASGWMLSTWQNMLLKATAIPIFPWWDPFYFMTEFEPEKACAVFFVCFCFFKSDTLTVFCKHLKNYLFSGVPHQFIAYLLYTRNWSYLSTSKWYYKKKKNQWTCHFCSLFNVLQTSHLQNIFYVYIHWNICCCYSI